MTDAGVVPADPTAKRPAHHVFQIGALQPRQFLGKERDALPVAAGHPGDIGAPEKPLRPERIEDAMQAVMDVWEWIGLRGVMRRTGGLDRNIRQFGEGDQLDEMDEGLRILAVPVQAAMIDDHLQVRMTFRDLAEFRQEDPAHHRKRQAFLLSRRP